MNWGRCTVLWLLGLLPAHLWAQSEGTRQPCPGFLQQCARDNPAGLKGYTLVEAAFDSVSAEKGGRYELTLFSGNAYRFIVCSSDEVPNVVLALLDLEGNLLLSNITPDGQGTYHTLEVTCTATVDYQVVIKPMKGSGCAGLVYGVK